MNYDELLFKVLNEKFNEDYEISYNEFQFKLNIANIFDIDNDTFFESITETFKTKKICSIFDMEILRGFLADTVSYFFFQNDSIRNYSSEIEDSNKRVKIIELYITKMLNKLKDFINEFFIKWIVNNYLKIDWFESNQIYDNNFYFKYKMKLLRIEFQKIFKSFIHYIYIANKQDYYKYILVMYEKDIQEKVKKANDMLNKGIKDDKKNRCIN